MGRRKKHDHDEPYISRKELMEKRGLTKAFIKNKLGPVMIDGGHRTKLYKLSEVDNFIEQMKAG